MVLLVNQHTVQVFTDVVNVFDKAGHETRLFTGDIEHGRVPLSSNVKRISSIRYNRRTTFTRMFSWITFGIHYFFYLLFCKKPSHIIVVTNPPIAPFVTSIVASLRNIPFSIVLFDLYPEALQQAGLSTNQSTLYRWWQSNNRWTFSKAASIITLSESMKSAAGRYVDSNKIKVIFNWADVEYIKPIEKDTNLFITRHQLQNKLVVLYSGNMGLTHDLESIIEAAHQLRNEKSIAFVMIGEGAKKKKLKDMADNYRLTNVMFLPYQNANDFPHAMAAADIGVVTLGTGAEGISVPSKTYVNMAAGLAIIAISPENSELDRIIKHYQVGYTVPPNYPDRIANIIRELSNDQEKLKKLGAQSRLTSLQFTSNNASSYINVIKLQTPNSKL